MPKTEEQLTAEGFTASGVCRYVDTVEEYSEDLYRRSVASGDNDKDRNLSREVTHEHVRSSAESIRYARPKKSKWMMASQIGEYLFTALAGVGGGKLDEAWGVGLFVVGVALATILIVFRLTNSN